jgi:hypothetical protein
MRKAGKPGWSQTSATSEQASDDNILTHNQPKPTYTMLTSEPPAATPQPKNKQTHNKTKPNQQTKN